MKALTVGGAMVDSIAIVENDRIERMEMHNADISFLLLEEGRKTEASEISTHSGGGAVNAAVSMSRIGLDVSTLIKLGQDQRADYILSRLEDEKVSTRWVKRDSRAPTGSSVMIASHHRDAAVFTFRGANTLLETDDLRDEAFAVDLVYITSLSNESADCFPILVEKAKAHNALIATNPGVRQLSARGGAFQEKLKDIDILSINHTEANALVPQFVATVGEGGEALPLKKGEQPPSLVLRGFSGGGFEITLARFVCAILERGPKYVVITSGGEGAFLAYDKGLLFCPSLKDVEVAGTAGGGDAFASTFAAYIAKGHDPEEAMQAATLNAASVISYADTQTGLLSSELLQEQIQKHKAQIPIRHWEIQSAGLC